MLPCIYNSSRFMWLSLLVLPLFLTCCRLPPSRQNLVMESNGGSFYFLSKDGLEVSLRVGPGKLFDWRFKNIGNQPLRIDMASMALTRQGDPEKYGLWGEPRPKPPDDPFLHLDPGGFANYSFPIRSKSPFWPFRPETSDSYKLEFTIRWGFRDYLYRLGFEVL